MVCEFPTTATTKYAIILNGCMIYTFCVLFGWSQPDNLSRYLYDAVTVYLETVDRMAATDKDYRNGKLVIQNMLSIRTFSGKI